MITFNPDKKLILTYGECLDPAMKITDQNEADQYFKAYVEYLSDQEKFPPTERLTMPAEDAAKINLGYWAGYYDSDTQQRILELFKVNHPVIPL